MIMDLNEEVSSLECSKWSIMAGHESEEERLGVFLEVPNWTKRKRSCRELVLTLGSGPEDSVESQGSSLSEPETSLCLGHSNDPTMGMHLCLGLPSQEEKEEEGEDTPPSDSSSSKTYPFTTNPKPIFNPIPSPSPSLNQFEERRWRRYAPALVQDKCVHGGCLAMAGIGPDLFRGVVQGNSHFTGEYQKRGGLPFPQLKRPAPMPGRSLAGLYNNNNARKLMIPSDVLVPRYMQKPKEEEEEEGEGVASPLPAPRLESRVHGATHLSFLAKISPISSEGGTECSKRSPVTVEDYPRRVKTSQSTLLNHPELAKSLPITFNYFPESLANGFQSTSEFYSKTSQKTFKYYPSLAKTSQMGFEHHPKQDKSSQTTASEDYPITLAKTSKMTLKD